MINNTDTEARVVSMKPRRATKSARERMEARFEVHKRDRGMGVGDDSKLSIILANSILTGFKIHYFLKYEVILWYKYFNSLFNVCLTQVLGHFI